MSQPGYSRRLSVAPLADVERQGRGSLGSGGLAMGISHSLPSDTHLIQGTHPLSGVQSRFHQGQGLGRGGSFSVGEGSHRAGSTPISGVLQPVICGDEGLRVVEASNRPLATVPEDSELFLQDGDTPVGSAFGPSWGLDGVSRLEGCVLAGSDASGISQVSQVRGLWGDLPVPSSLLWPLHGSSGLHLGHGSCFGFSAPIRHSVTSLPRRLAHPGLLPRAGSPCSGFSPSALFFAGDSRQLGEVAADSIAAHGISLGPSGLYLFQGFSCPQESREASLNWRRILVLRAAASVILAGAAGCTGLTDSARSGREASDAVSTVSSQAVLGSDRPVDSRSVDSGDPWRSGVVARSRSLGARYFARPSVPSARLMVRRLGHGLGSSFGRGRYFRPLVSRRTGTVHQRQGALGHRKSSVVLRSADPGLLCRCVCGQFHRDCLSPQSGGYNISAAECHSAADSALGRGASCGSSSTVHRGSTQRAGGFSVSSQPDLGFRMDPQDRGISGPEEEVAGVHRPLCHLTRSPMLSIFFTIPRSERLCYGYSAPELEWVAGVCLSSLVTHSGSPQEAPVVLWSSPDTHSSVSASTALVPGSPGSGGGRSGGSASVSGPSSSAPFSSASSEGVRAVASCLETIQRFAQAKGFSKHVAKQSALARRSSSRAGYQARWSIYRQWCHGKGHSVSRPSMHKIADFLFWLRRSKKLSISAVLGYRSMLSAVFHTVLPEISTSPVIQDLLLSFMGEAPCRAIRPPTWDLLKVLTYLRPSVFQPLPTASLRDLTHKTLFLVALATAKRGGELQALSRFVSFSSSAAGVSLCTRVFG